MTRDPIEPTDSMNKARELENKIWYTNRGMVVDVPEKNREILAQALDAARLEALEKSFSTTIQVLNDYPDITVQDLAWIKNAMFQAFNKLKADSKEVDR